MLMPGMAQQAVATAGEQGLFLGGMRFEEVKGRA